MPLLRVTCFVRTLHPQASGSSVVWSRDRPDPRAVRILRGMEETPAFQASPLPLIFKGAAAIRRRLDRSGEGRVGKEGVRTCRFRWWADNEKQKKHEKKQT